MCSSSKLAQKVQVLFLSCFPFAHSLFSIHVLVHSLYYERIGPVYVHVAVFRGKLAAILSCFESKGRVGEPHSEVNALILALDPLAAAAAASTHD